MENLKKSFKKNIKLLILTFTNFLLIVFLIRFTMFLYENRGAIKTLEGYGFTKTIYLKKGYREISGKRFVNYYMFSLKKPNISLEKKTFK